MYGLVDVDAKLDLALYHFQMASQSCEEQSRVSSPCGLTDVGAKLHQATHHRRTTPPGCN
jgi:hypothetical protein